MDNTEKNKNSAVTLTLSGMLDVKIAAKLEAEIMSELADTNKLLLDFKDVTYVSSSGLRVLLTCDKAAKEKGGKMTLINVSSFVMQIFTVTGFSSILSFK